jgi:hypothetical protein
MEYRREATRRKMNFSGNINRDQDQRTGIEYLRFIPSQFSLDELERQRESTTTNNENLWFGEKGAEEYRGNSGKY